MKRAAAAARRAREEYRRAVLEAHAAGASDADIGRAAGVSRQAIAVILRRAAQREEKP